MGDQKESVRNESKSINRPATGLRQCFSAVVGISVTLHHQLSNPKNLQLVKKFVLSTIALACSISLVLAWGAWGHQHINRAAVFALPAQMRGFFYNHIDFITEESVVPDLRKYALGDKFEFPRHFINLESYGSGNWDTLPKTMKDLKAKYDDKTLQGYGILPWYIEEMQQKLTEAFKSGIKTEILFIAGDLGHYIADAHMPLHTAINHNGQLTGQKGIHAFWEGQLPEMFGDQYNLWTGDATYISDVPGQTWKMILSSHQLADTLLSIDRELSATFPKEKIYQLDENGNIKKNKFNDPVHSVEYSRKYHELLGGMIELQMRKAIAQTANYWYTAWVDAGKPSLEGMDPESLTKKNQENLSRELRLWRVGKLTDLKADREF